MVAKVWILKEQVSRTDVGHVAFDYSPALEFGDIEFIFGLLEGHFCEISFFE